MSAGEPGRERVGEAKKFDERCREKERGDTKSWSRSPTLTIEGGENKRPAHISLSPPPPAALSRSNDTKRRKSIASVGLGSNEARGLAARGGFSGNFISVVNVTALCLSPAAEGASLREQRLPASLSLHFSLPVPEETQEIKTGTYLDRRAL